MNMKKYINIWNCCLTLTKPEMLLQMSLVVIGMSILLEWKWNLCPRYYWLRLRSRICYFTYYWHQTIRSASNNLFGTLNFSFSIYISSYPNLTNLNSFILWHHALVAVLYYLVTDYLLFSSSASITHFYFVPNIY